MADRNDALDMGEMVELSIDQLDQVSGGFIPIKGPTDDSAPGSGTP